jgi:hypothetical protein
MKSRQPKHLFYGGTWGDNILAGEEEFIPNFWRLRLLERYSSRDSAGSSAT